MKKLIIMVGVAGSGKSTIAKELYMKNKGSVLISSDEIREVMGLNQDSKSHTMVFDTVHRRIETEMERSRDVIIVDATNLKKYFRRSYLDLARKHRYEIVAYYVNTDVKKCLSNNEGRGLTVPADVIIRQNTYAEPPIKEEGWDEIVEVLPDKEKPASLWNKLTKFIKGGK